MAGISVQIDRAAMDRAWRNMAPPWMARFGNRVLSNASRRANVDTGRLRSSLHMTLIDQGTGVVVGTNVEYAAFVHDGTRPHIIRPRRRGGVLRFVQNGRVRYARYVRHPGYRGNPFLLDAMEQEAARLR